MRMKRSLWPIPLVAAALITAACGGDDEAETVRIDPPPGALGVSDEQQPTPGFDLLQQAPFQPGPAAQGQVLGRATLMMPTAEAGTPDGMQLEIRLEGLQPDVEYGWHMFMGRCSDEGTLTVGVSPGAAGASPDSQTGAVAQALRASPGSIATQTAVLPTAQITPQQLPLRPYSVRVFRGLSPLPAQMVACADVGSSGDPAQP